MTLNDTIPAGTLNRERFVWNDDCPAWPVHLTRDEGLAGRAWVTAPVLLAMLKAVAANNYMGQPFVDDEDAIEQVANIARSSTAIYEGRVMYDVSQYVLNTGSMEIDIIEQAGYEDLDDPNGLYHR